MRTHTFVLNQSRTHLMLNNDKTCVLCHVHSIGTLLVKCPSQCEYITRKMYRFSKETTKKSALVIHFNRHLLATLTNSNANRADHFYELASNEERERRKKKCLNICILKSTHWLIVRRRNVCATAIYEKNINTQTTSHTHTYKSDSVFSLPEKRETNTVRSKKQITTEQKKYKYESTKSGQICSRKHSILHSVFAPAHSPADPMKMVPYAKKMYNFIN